MLSKVKKVLVVLSVVGASIAGYLFYDNQLFVGECLQFNVGDSSIVHDLVFEVVSENKDGDVEVKFHDSMKSLYVNSIDQIIEIQLFLMTEFVPNQYTGIILSKNMERFTEISCPDVVEEK